MTIYTGTGDRGNTGLFSGERVGKDYSSVEAYGELDELNSILGALAASLQDGIADRAADLQAIQSDLLNIGSWMATTPGSPFAEQLVIIDNSRVVFLEEGIDRMEADMPALVRFILPGGHMTSAWAHIARAVCRRVERRVVQISRTQGPESASHPYQAILCYLNRLSDYLFVLARYCNHTHGVSDIEWRK